MKKLFALLCLLCILPTAFSQDIAPVAEPGSTWVKVPVNDTDSVWVKISVTDIITVAPPSRPSADETPIVSHDTIAPCTMPAVAVATPGRHADWNNDPQPEPRGVHFAWGAEAGTSVDVSGQDMSSIDISASFGLSAGILNFAGVGAGAHVPVSNSCRSYPLFVVLRSDFSRNVQPLFIDLRGGVSLNYLPMEVTQTGAYGSASVGFRLASGVKFRSYITAGYSFFDRRTPGKEGFPERIRPMSMVTLRLGVRF